jgi:hypothetical protein
VKILLVTNDRDLVAEATKAYERTDELSVYGKWQDALEASSGAGLLIVDLLATLTEAHRISGYEEFAAHKMTHKKAKEVPLVIISPPDDYDLDSMVGWPEFVFGHVRRPVTMKIFRRISTWV